MIARDFSDSILSISKYELKKNRVYHCQIQLPTQTDLKKKNNAKISKIELLRLVINILTNVQLLLRKKATEELKKEQEMKAAERRKVTSWKNSSKKSSMRFGLVQFFQTVVRKNIISGDRWKMRQTQKPWWGERRFDNWSSAKNLTLVFSFI